MSENIAVVENETTEILEDAQGVTNEPINNDIVDPVEPPVEESTEVKPDDENVVEEPDKPAVKTPHKSIDKRLEKIQAATWEKHEAGRIADEKIARLEEMQKAQGQVQPPNVDNYDDNAKYQSDTQKFYEGVAKQNSTTQVNEQVTQRQQAKKDSDQSAQWQYDCEKESETNPKYQDNYNAVSRTTAHYKAGAMEEAITTSKLNTKIINYLAVNPQESENIATSSPFQQIKAIGAIEQKLSTTKRKKPTTTPAPVVPVGGGGAVARKDVTKMSQNEYNNYMNEMESGKR